MTGTLSGYAAENYKAFAETASLEIRPLTLLFGFNSSGKSALLRLLPLLRDSILSDGKRPLALTSKAARGASFDDLKCQISSSPVVKFGLKWQKRRTFFPRRSVSIASADFTIRDLPDLRTQVVEELRLLTSDGSEYSLVWVPSSAAGKLTTLRYIATSPGEEPLEVLADFDGLIPRLRTTKDLENPIARVLPALAVALRRLAKDVYWLQALRGLPARREDFTGPAPTLAADGSDIVQMLLEDESRGSTVLDEISDWYQAATAHRLELRKGTFAGKELFSFALVPLGSKMRGIEIVDTGEGMGQVLPVIGLLAFAKHGRLGSSPILSIEHPELHLHTSAHPALATLFCEVAQSSRRTSILVETHSENFLLRVQLAIVKGELDPKKVAIYWVRSSDEGTSAIDKIEFDNLGRPMGDRWPPGIFAETMDQSRELVRTRQALERK
ncbi:AAA family ATPase [Bradyrhizobium sp. 188]|uniref:AAA family ATPase n=1 Tax=Bradyrhizobium sp. 188 TaxID=2782656 RepID=UPI001FF807DD|nr:AAA family ATPase [Bradyrhizobium sp. 188]MCK1496082.1 AAA family ATPase [Bradyrhizobium sp. 188]